MQLDPGLRMGSLTMGMAVVQEPRTLFGQIPKLRLRPKFQSTPPPGAITPTGRRERRR
jgi:hypothetical protein